MKASASSLARFAAARSLRKVSMLRERTCHQQEQNTTTTAQLCRSKRTITRIERALESCWPSAILVTIAHCCMQSGLMPEPETSSTCSTCLPVPTPTPFKYTLLSTLFRDYRPMGQWALVFADASLHTCGNERPVSTGFRRCGSSPLQDLFGKSIFQPLRLKTPLQRLMC